MNFLLIKIHIKIRLTITTTQPHPPSGGLGKVFCLTIIKKLSEGEVKNNFFF